LGRGRAKGVTATQKSRLREKKKKQYPEDGGQEKLAAKKFLKGQGKNHDKGSKRNSQPSQSDRKGNPSYLDLFFEKERHRKGQK